MKVYVLTSRDGSHVYSVHRSVRRAESEAERLAGETLVWAGGGSDQWHRYGADYRIARCPAHLAPKVGSRAGPRVVT